MLPYMVLRLAFEQGALGIAFLQEPPNENGRVTCWDRLRLLLNLFLVPNLWRPLTREEELEIWTRGLNCGGSYSRWKTDGGCNQATG